MEKLYVNSSINRSLLRSGEYLARIKSEYAEDTQKSEYVPHRGILFIEKHCEAKISSVAAS